MGAFAPRRPKMKASIMPDSAHVSENFAKPGGAFLWDMAGTLIAYDGITGRPGAIPGGEEFLPELGKLFRLFVTTGDETENACSMLRGFELLRHFEAVYGDLYTPSGQALRAHLARGGLRPGSEPGHRRPSAQ